MVRVLIALFTLLIILWHVIDPAHPVTADNGLVQFTWCRQTTAVWAIAPLVVAYLILIYGGETQHTTTVAHIQSCQTHSHHTCCFCMSSLSLLQESQHHELLQRDETYQRDSVQHHVCRYVATRTQHTQSTHEAHTHTHTHTVCPSQHRMSHPSLTHHLFTGTVFVAAYMIIVTTEQQATLVAALGVLVVINVAVGVLFVPKLSTGEHTHTHGAHPAQHMALSTHPQLMHST